jgi:hypothetical protein
MTANGTVHLNCLWGSSILIVIGSIAEYIRTYSHEDSYWEIDAENHFGGKPYVDPDSGGTALEWIVNVISTYIEALS